jgi:hypothetical protein
VDWKVSQTGYGRDQKPGSLMHEFYIIEVPGTVPQVVCNSRIGAYVVLRQQRRE